MRVTVFSLVLVVTLPAYGADPFSLTAQTSSGPPLTITGTSQTLPDLIAHAFDTEDQFAALSGRAFTVSLRYGGIANAATFSRNAAGTSATLTIPSQNFTKNFTAANEGDLKDQLRDFFIKNSPNAYSKFLR